MQSQPQEPTATRTPIQVAALVVGLVFLAVGILGFVPGITTNYDELEFAGHESGAALFGTFSVSVLHNVVHLLFGVAGIAMARTAAAARLYLVGGGVIYLVLWVYGLVVDQHSTANFIPVNSADNWLHLGLGAAMVAVGLVLGRVGSAAHPAITPRHT
ncbi:DUF4383 domain-containing protein [Rhodococcus maanshanensis]|uniref:DUF4383 domain-containing protein n=1 Tax=Rhodococcus maanshanensis TaxID=183556 RepID=A0A1H7LQI3_9NOCA|nr:DUF4383 domain-containing protein [Rhodococcus maanshanensis]SEL00988.1 protein of unknown function [Rhodococcus maanshanensis]